MSDADQPPPPGEREEPEGTPPPPGGYTTPPPPGGYTTPPPPGGYTTPPPPGGYTTPPPGGFGPPPATPYQPGGAGPIGPAGTNLADPGKRILALLLDGVLLLVVVALPLAVFLNGPAGGVAGATLDAGSLVAGLVSTVLYFLYYALLIGLRGQTVGGMVMKIRVIDQDGPPATVEHGVKRSAWVLLGLVPCVGGLAQLVLVIWGLVNLFNDPLRQTPWDKFGRTVVVDA
jgi:uncharacterized RDD family membrane protein YckC